ncbi:hypothetical protein [Nostoc sp.]|uniref:hypothetical protein n=1 Tax=Nostoc sp. TaxID=1180 RepID=UPI002FFA360C
MGIKCVIALVRITLKNVELSCDRQVYLNPGLTQLSQATVRLCRTECQTTR